MSLTKEIKDFALALGYSAVGIAPAQDFEQHRKIMAERAENYEWFINRPFAPKDWFNPQDKVPFAKSIIVLVYDYAQRSFPDSLSKIIGRVYQSRSYNAPTNTINGGRYELFKEFIGSKDIQFQDAPWMPQRWAGALAGVTTFGKNNCAYLNANANSNANVNANANANPNSNANASPSANSTTTLNLSANSSPNANASSTATTAEDATTPTTAPTTTTSGGSGGSFIVLSTLLVDAQLEYDQPTLDSACPANCTLCIDACPTGALLEPYLLESSRCIAFNNWVAVEANGFGPAQTVPLEFRPLLGTRIHGCDVCQEVCPRNQKRLKAQLPADAFLETIAPEMTLENLLHMPEGFYEQRVYPLMYNYIRDPAIFQRNAAIAMANTANPAYIPHLITELSNFSLTVRAHVAWALGQFATPNARAALEQQLSAEKNELVRAEIKLALGE